ncbi:MAG: hypothetical protein AAB410_04520 [Patescibacteria group bacterium]
MNEHLEKPMPDEQLKDFFETNQGKLVRIVLKNGDAITGILKGYHSEESDKYFVIGQLDNPNFDKEINLKTIRGLLPNELFDAK